jgi:hypothetical protein
MIKKFLATLALAVVLTAGVTVPSAPAQAAWSDCGNYPGTVCLFAHGNWGLPIWRQTGEQVYNAPGHCRNLTGFDNVTTMVSNNTSHYVLIVWRYIGCTGDWFQADTGQYYDLSGGWWNDKPSSVSVIAL